VDVRAHLSRISPHKSASRLELDVGTGYIRLPRRFSAAGTFRLSPSAPGGLAPRERSVYRRASSPRPSPSVRKLLQWDTRPGGNAAPSPYQRTIDSYRFSNDSALDLLVHCGTIFPPRDGLATGSQRRWRADHRKFWRNGQGRYQVNVGVFSKWRGFRYGYKEPSSFGDAALSCLAPL
jgi:hypothetical protein